MVNALLSVAQKRVMTYFNVTSQTGDVVKPGGGVTGTPSTSLPSSPLEVNHNSNPKNHQNTNNQRLENACMRCGILATGLFLGLFTLMPNVMMSDSGTPKALRAANIGMTASALFAIGGVAGCIFNSWWCLLPGLIMQIVMFIYVG